MLQNVFATNSICTPSRAVILTGQYSHLNGVTMFNLFDSSRTTVAQLLQRGGYHTGMIGKWHLGSDPVGFDRWEILPGQGSYHDPRFYTATSDTTYTGRYVTDVITDLAIEFLDERPKDRPFFLMMHHKAPHRPWDPTDEHGAHFATQRIPEPVTFWDNYETRTDALHENQQRVAKDMTNRDLKLPPPPGLEGQALARWRLLKPDTVTITSGPLESRRCHLFSGRGSIPAALFAMRASRIISADPTRGTVIPQPPKRGRGNAGLD